MFRPSLFRSLPFLLLLGFWSSGQASVQAATLTVPAQYATIQAAVNAAVNGDTVLISDGTYSGDGNRDISFNGKNITVTSVNGAASTIIDCGGIASSDGSGNHRGFYFFRSGETSAVINGLTIENGYEIHPNTAGGGAIYSVSVGVTIQNCIFKNNTAAQGDNGGAISNYNNQNTIGTIAVINCLFKGNTASEGGGIYNLSEGGSPITVTNCTLTGNIASYGGGILNYNDLHGTVIVSNCTLIGNSATYSGGGIENQSQVGTQIIVTNCVLTNNTASYGGGMDNSNPGGTTSVTNCTLTGNSADTAGGGIDNAISLGGLTTLTNDILYGDVRGEVVTHPGTTVEASVIDCDVQGGYSGTGNIDADPLFVNAANGDLHLQAGSPCFGAGTANGAPATDFDGKMRPNPPSIGAYELAATNTLTTHTQILWDNANGQASLWRVNADGTFTSNVYGPYTGWTSKAVSDGPDGVAHLLWTNTNGQASVWNVTGSGFTSHQYGPYTNYAAVSLSTGGDGTSHLLWDNANGTASLWNVNTTSGAFTSHEYGPYAGWTATAVASGATVTDLLWNNTDGQAAGYRVAADGSLTTHVFGPYANYGAKALSVGPDDEAHLLWDNSNGIAALWSVDFSTGVFNSPLYGPFSGWEARAMATGPDGVTHLLWNHAPDNQASLWAVTGSGFTAKQYGPYSGWQAVALSAGM